MTRNNYKFNIAKECLLCGNSFITDIFNEEDNCEKCSSVYSYCLEDDSKGYVIDDLMQNGWSRTAAIRYE